MKPVCGRLVLILGDQLDRQSPALAQASLETDVLLMLELRAESTRIPVHKARIVQFLAAMRHHADWLRGQGYRLDYRDLHHPCCADLKTALTAAIVDWQPAQLVLVEPGEFHLRTTIEDLAQRLDCPLVALSDSHFLADHERFHRWRTGRKSLVMEYFYRELRRELNVLMVDGKPMGGQWNFDKQNRKPFGRKGPGWIPPITGHSPDPLTRKTMADVESAFADNPGSLDSFRFPVTREQALQSLDEFIDQRLPTFGPFQDAMWSGEAWLYHAAISAALNLKLLNPREVIEQVAAAHAAGRVDIASAEGFVRQILGWREYVRGIYWSEMPDYLERNALHAQQPLPDFYWTGDTDMNCLREVIGQTLALGYAHHIQRLMVTGLFALLHGVRPDQIHQWYLAVYVDAVEWVEAPNTLGMSQYADGGLLASKPYAASGQYIKRMSNYCGQCRFRPDRSTGDDACPISVLYWDFLARHRERFEDHPRTALQWQNLQRKSDAEIQSIQRNAHRLRQSWA